MRIEITCSNRVGILQEIMGIFSEFRINVRSGELGGDSGDKVYLSAPGLLANQYQAIEKSLHRIPGVQKVRRISLIPSERRHFELDTLLRHVTDPVLSVDREGHIVAANLAAARAFGVSLTEVPGMQLQRFLPRLQLTELLRGLTAPRYGFPVTVRGRAYTLDWSPIALADDPGVVASLAGAVLTLQENPASGSSGQELPPEILWDLDRRRESCLRLQQLAPLPEPLLISGEPGSGKTTFLHAAYYLCPLAEKGQFRLYSGEDFVSASVTEAAALGKDAVVLIDDLQRAPAEAQRKLTEYLLGGHLIARLMVTATACHGLEPALQQIFATGQIHLPPLRSMRPAIQGFATRILQASGSGEPLECADSLIEQLRLRDWPSNLRGLKTHLQAAILSARGRGATCLEREDLPAAAVDDRLPWQNWGRGLTLPEQLAKVERAILAEILTELPEELHSSRELAKRLGISHTAVANKLRKYELPGAARKPRESEDQRS
ncbi:PAS domain-containing protein [Microbulbifer bruguierae]|uniref:HTH-type transcriptional regulatory protein TyrR n=1 Tax=Microbulbifer bruguierae TaxID=3029061 RepID=A0ABY8NDD7_9GAMM|nr:TyrR/PhhR family helix-turn-helix DNA-binding protein [Microbulbifer bruguierae]WGL16936.1 PAS domain-containing protein [Microbulbifer bruguierae]